MKIRNCGDWVIALAVIASSAALFVVLALALSGTFVGRPGFTLYVDFHDLTGVNVNAPVKLAGAPAGWVADIRILSQAERLKLADSANSVRAKLVLNRSVPLPGNDVSASVSSDTILSEKFILLDAGSAAAPAVEDGAILTGITPTPFDQLVRNADTTLVAVNTLLSGGTAHPTAEIFPLVRAVIERAGTLIEEASPVLENLNAAFSQARELVTETHTFLSENRQPVAETLRSLGRASQELETFAADGKNLLASSKHAFNSAAADFKVSAQNTKLATTYARILALQLAQNPSQLVWGRRAIPPLPTEREILQAPKPIPLKD